MLILGKLSDCCSNAAVGLCIWMLLAVHVLQPILQCADRYTYRSAYTDRWQLSRRNQLIDFVGLTQASLQLPACARGAAVEHLFEGLPYVCSVLPRLCADRQTPLSSASTEESSLPRISVPDTIIEMHHLRAEFPSDNDPIFSLQSTTYDYLSGTMHWVCCKLTHCLLQVQLLSSP